LFNNPRIREFLGIMARLPPKKNEVTYPGFMGFIRRRLEYSSLAWKNVYQATADRHRAFNSVGRDSFGNGIKYETKTKGKADKRAKSAGLVEKLK